MSQLILFGAGASFGVGSVVPNPPPLGNKLFTELVRHFPHTWGAMPAEYSDLFATNFEVGMEQIWSHESMWIAQLMQDMAIYFAQFGTRNPDNSLYSRLVRHINRRRLRTTVTLSTLNYECLLDQSIWNSGVGICYSGVPEPDQFRLLKLHGGCNFLPYQIGASRGVRFGSGVSFEAGIRYARSAEEIKTFCRGNNVLPPAMSIFMPGKPVQISPGAIGQIQREWQMQVAKANDIAVIGVFPNSLDRHIWDPLATSAGRLHYVGGQADFEGWRQKHRPNLPTVFVGETFEASFEQIVNSVL